MWHGKGDIRLDDVDDPRVLEPTDAIIRITRSAICGTDLHMVRGTMPDMVEGTVLGHEAVSDDQAILLSDIFPTAWFGARLAEIGDGDTVLVLTGVVDPTAFITRHEKPTSALDAYRLFDLREDGWLKTVLDVA